MSSESTTGQDAPVIDNEATQLEAAQDKATTTDAQTDGADGGTEVPEVEKTFTQAELDEILQKRLAKAERRARKEARQEALTEFSALRPQQTEKQSTDEKPTPTDGETNESYIDRLTDWKLEQRDKQASQQRQQEQARTLSQKTEVIYANAEKIAGFDREEFDALPLTRSIVETLIDSDVAPQLMHYMSNNPDEVERIARLSERRQAAELGKIEAKLAADPPPKKVSNAPQPLNAVRKPSGAAKITDTTDPRAAKELSTSEWIKAEEARMRRKLAGT